jgi:hypothetical protein
LIPQFPHTFSTVLAGAGAVTIGPVVSAWDLRDWGCLGRTMLEPSAEAVGFLTGHCNVESGLVYADTRHRVIHKSCTGYQKNKWLSHKDCLF